MHKQVPSFIFFCGFVKNIFIAICVMTVIISCSISPHADKNTISQTNIKSDSGEVIKHDEPFPERLRINMYYSPRWQPALLTHATDDRYTLEFWPYGQNKSYWKDVIQINYYNKSVRGHDIDQHLDEYQQRLQKKCPEVELKTLSQTDGDLVYTWSISNCDAIEQQYEIGRYIKSRHGVHQIKYAAKGAVPSEKYFKRWVRAVESAKVIDAKKYAKIKSQKDIAWRR